MALADDRLRGTRCGDPLCGHVLGEHGLDRYCYGLRRRPDGSFVNCVCRRFRVPDKDASQTPPQVV